MRSKEKRAVVGKEVGIRSQPDFQTPYKAAAVNPAWRWHRDGRADQRHRIECADIETHTEARWLSTQTPRRPNETGVSPCGVARWPRPFLTPVENQLQMPHKPKCKARKLLEGNVHDLGLVQFS